MTDDNGDPDRIVREPYTVNVDDSREMEVVETSASKIPLLGWVWTHDMNKGLILGLILGLLVTTAIGGSPAAQEPETKTVTVECGEDYVDVTVPVDERTTVCGVTIETGYLVDDVEEGSR